MGDRFKAVMSTDEVRCQAVENELKKLHSRLGSVEELSESTLQKAINDLEAIKREISNRSSGNVFNFLFIFITLLSFFLTSPFS